MDETNKVWLQTKLAEAELKIELLQKQADALAYAIRLGGHDSFVALKRYEKFKEDDR